MPGLMELLFLLAAWAVVPLGLRLLPESAPLRLARKLQPAFAALVTISFFLPKGPVAAALALPWLALNGLVALGGLLRLRTALREGIPRLLQLAAMFFPIVGGIHLVASRYGYPLAGFPEPIILLTAIHFHYTVFAVPILASLAGRSRLALSCGLGVVGGTPIVAAGFLFAPILKIVGVGILCVSVVGIAIGQLTLVPSRTGRARALLALSSLSVIAGMILAGVYEHGFYTGRSWISIPQMTWSHGILNGVGFSLLGLLAWTAEAPRAADRPVRP
ncbi:MAG: YndJ family protein [Planctomycetaceae bacterium]|nr:YndJ family protein [Planctomycetaceae bacterium]